MPSCYVAVEDAAGGFFASLVEIHACSGSHQQSGHSECCWTQMTAAFTMHLQYDITINEHICIQGPESFLHHCHLHNSRLALQLLSAAVAERSRDTTCPLNHSRGGTTFPKAELQSSVSRGRCARSASPVTQTTAAVRSGATCSTTQQHTL